MEVKMLIENMINNGYKLKSSGDNVKFNLRGNFDVSIEELKLPDRQYNALRRSKINTIEELLNILELKEYSKLRGVGKKGIKEINNQILNWYFNSLSKEKQTKFLKDLFY